MSHSETTNLAHCPTYPVPLRLNSKELETDQVLLPSVGHCTNSLQGVSDWLLPSELVFQFDFNFSPSSRNRLEEREERNRGIREGFVSIYSFQLSSSK